MTYCIAWKKNNKLYFVSDSATSTIYKEARLSENEESFTSFGELEDKYDRYYVHERQNKLTVINERIIICFAGNVTHGFEMIRVFEECISLELNIVDSIDIVFNSTFTSDVQMLIGYVEDKDNKPKLYLLKDRASFEGDLFEIGSGALITEWSEKVRKWLGYKKISQEHLLSIMTSIVQVYSVKYHMVRFGVGGTVTGVQLDGNEVQWSGDINYNMLSPSGESEGFITTINRDGMLVTLSTFTGQVKYLLGYSHSNYSRDDVLERNTYIIDQLSDAETDYLVLTNLYRNKTLVLYIGGKIHNQLFRMWRRDKGEETDYLLVFGEFIYGLLFTSLHGDDDEMTLHFADVTELQTDYVSLEEFEKWTGGRGNIIDTREYY